MHQDKKESCRFKTGMHSQALKKKYSISHFEAFLVPQSTPNLKLHNYLTLDRNVLRKVRAAAPPQ